MISLVRRALALLFVAAAPAAASTPAAPAAASRDTVVFGGGCFWGVQAVFQHVKGVVAATSGYAGGSRANPSYEHVTRGTTGHAEVVRVIYDPAKVTYEQLLQVFFDVAHDPTQLNRQGPDRGTQYRSALYFTKDVQRTVAQVYVAQLVESGHVKRPIVTEIAPLRAFYRAEQYHQDYASLHPDEPYIVHHDAPKLADLEKRYRALWTGKRAKH